MALSSEEKRKISRCKTCKIIGHWAGDAECKAESGTSVEEPTRSSNEKSAVSQTHTLKIMLSIRKFYNGLDALWVADTGATAHMCNNIDWFKSIELFGKPDKCLVGDGAEIPIIGIGVVEFESTVGNLEITGTLTDVLYIPGLATNIISIGAAADKGVITQFTDNKCVLIKEGIIYGGGNRSKKDLYMMNIKPIIHNIDKLLYIRIERTMQEWHKSLGHAGDERIKTLARDNGTAIAITDKASYSAECPDCGVGKAKHTTHPARKEQSTTRIGDNVQIDLSGIDTKNKESYDCQKYFLLCKDEHSEYCFVFLLPDKTKLVVARKLDELITRFEAESGCCIKNIHSDRGSEFLNETVKFLLDKERITSSQSASYTPAQNGKIEREMGSTTNMARTMLLASGLPINLWSEAIRTACYIRNRLPTKKNSSTPFERFTGKKPYVAHMNEFGAEVQVLVNWDHLFKWSGRTEPGHLVGYTVKRNTFRVYLPALNKVIETSDVIFRKHTENRPLVANDSEKEKIITIPLLNCESMSQQTHAHISDYQPESETDAQVLNRTSDQDTQLEDTQSVSPNLLNPELAEQESANVATYCVCVHVNDHKR